MRKFKATFIVLSLLLLCTVLNSCLSVDRKIKLNRDGSGEETMKISFMKEFFAMVSSMSEIMDSTKKQAFIDSLYNDQIFMDKTRSEYDSIPGIKVLDIFSERNPDSSFNITVKYSFDSISRLGSAMESTLSDDKPKDPAIVTLIREGDELVFSYIYENNKLTDEMEEGDSLMTEMRSGMSKLFGSGAISFEIEFPYEIISSNAVSSGGNILKWSYPMSEVFLIKDLKLEARLKE